MTRLDWVTRLALRVRREGGWQNVTRVYGESVEAQARKDGRPVRFVWRSRLYTVRAILEH